MEKLKGKKLLILGGSENEISLVQRAKELGIYAVVADYYEDYEISPAKKFADEVWNASWADIDLMEKLCKEARIDGVVAGYSEFRVESQIKLCQRLGLPCYCTMEQLELTRDKRKFKDTCIANGVPVIHEYKSVQEVSAYPVIVKPVDRGGSIGISVATNKEELIKAYEYAMEMSVTKDVIIEDYIYNATKIDLYYEIIDGEIIFLTCNDTINAQNNGFSKVVQSSWLFPSKYASVLMEKADAPIRKMLKNMGITNGYIFISGFADDAGNVAFFETGFRLCGGHLYDYYEALGHSSNLDLFITHALTGSCRNLRKNKEKMRSPDLKCIALNFYSKKGTISAIDGLEKVQKMPQCGLVLCNAHIGQVCNDDKAILPKVAMVHFWSTDPAELELCAQKAYEKVLVTGENGEDLIYDRIDTSVISGWWNKK